MIDENALLNPKLIDEGTIAEWFRSSANILSDFCFHATGKKIVPYSDKKLTHFFKLSFDEQVKAVSDLVTYLSVCKQTLEMGFELNDTPRFMWIGLKKLGLIAPHDFLNLIKTNDVVEVYNLENRQIFRNFEFFKYCLYTIEDIFCRPWMELYFRPDMRITTEMVEKLPAFFASDVRILNEPISDHRVQQTDFGNQGDLHFRIRHLVKAVGAKKSNQSLAYISIESVKFIEN